MNRKLERANATLKRELGALITTTLLDPRIAPLTTVAAVETSRDLGVATVRVNVLGGDEARSATLVALESAAVMLRESLKERVRMRHVPRLRFRVNDSLERGDDLLALMDRLADERRDGGRRNGAAIPRAGDARRAGGRDGSGR